MFKENDEVRMTKDTSLWSNGDRGRIIIVDKSDTNLPYYVCLHQGCKDAENYEHYDYQFWMSKTDVEAIHMLMKVE